MSERREDPVSSRLKVLSCGAFSSSDDDSDDDTDNSKDGEEDAEQPPPAASESPSASPGHGRERMSQAHFFFLAAAANFFPLDT